MKTAAMHTRPLLVRVERYSAARNAPTGLKF